MARGIDPTGRTATHCDPPERECRFDLVDGWGYGHEIGSVILCETHGLLAPGEVYLLDPYVDVPGKVAYGDDLLAARAKATT